MNELVNHHNIIMLAVAAVLLDRLSFLIRLHNIILRII